MTTLVNLIDYTKAPAPTFELPPDIVRKNLHEGQLVKVAFEVRHSQIAGERMWVQVTGILPEGVYTGILRNDPVAMPLKFGESVNFTWRNVIAVAD